MNKICVYTCITGNYDNLKSIKFKEKNIDYVCITNNKSITSKDWKIVYVDEDLDNLTLSRKIKILHHKYLIDYELTVYIDGAVEIRRPISEFLSKCCDLEKYDMIGFKHQFRNCIYDEINECVRVGKEKIDNALVYEKFLKDNKYPKNNGLNENTILIRKNVESVNKLMEFWYGIVSKYSRRDQLSFNYSLWKNPVKINVLNMWAYDNPYFLHDQHSNKYKNKKYRLYCGNATKFDFHKCVDGQYTIDELKNGLNIKLPFDTDRLELTIDEVGNCIESVSLNKKNTSFIYNTCEINSKKYFYDSSIISFEGEFKKNDNLVFNIDIETSDDNSLKLIAEENMKLVAENRNLKNSIDKLNQELNSVYNSKSWKVTKPLRKLSNKVNKA